MWSQKYTLNLERKNPKSIKVLKRKEWNTVHEAYCTFGYSVLILDFTWIQGLPAHCIMIKFSTNHGILMNQNLPLRVHLSEACTNSSFNLMINNGVVDFKAGTLCYLHTTNSSRSNPLNGLSNSHSISHWNTVSTISRTVHQDIDMRSAQRIDLHNRIQSLCLNIFSQSNKNCLQVVIWTNLRQPTHNRA